MDVDGMYFYHPAVGASHATPQSPVSNSSNPNERRYVATPCIPQQASTLQAITW